MHIKRSKRYDLDEVLFNLCNMKPETTPNDEMIEMICIYNNEEILKEEESSDES